MRRNNFAMALMAACMAGLLTGHALAQQSGRGPGMMQGNGPGYGYGMMQPGYGGWGMMQGYGAGMMPGWGMMDGHSAGMLAFLKAEIGITPAQEPQWATFAAALKAMADGGPGQHGRMMNAPDKAEPLPDALATRVAWMESHLAALKEMQKAAGPLYAALDTTQKAKADSLLGCGYCGR